MGSSVPERSRGEGAALAPRCSFTSSGETAISLLTGRQQHVGFQLLQRLDRIVHYLPRMTVSPLRPNVGQKTQVSGRSMADGLRFLGLIAATAERCPDNANKFLSSDLVLFNLLKDCRPNDVTCRSSMRRTISWFYCDRHGCAVLKVRSQLG